MDERLESLLVLVRRGAGPTMRVFEAALVAGIGLAAARLVWLMVEPGGAVSPDVPVRTADAQPRNVAASISVDTSRLVHENPFATTSGVMAGIPDTPETSLNLILRGVRASSNEAGGIAFITTPDNRTATYAPGDVILDGVTLNRIHADRVTLRKGGQVEALLMEGGAGLLSVLTQPGASDPDASVPPASQDDAYIARADLVSTLTIDPVHRGRQFVGYRIDSREDNAALARAGLQPGDVVVGVDGAPVTGISPAVLVRKFSNSHEVRLQIDRAGTMIDHTLAPEEARPQ